MTVQIEARCLSSQRDEKLRGDVGGWIKLSPASILFLFCACLTASSPACRLLCARLPLFCGMRGMYARHRRSKVEGEPLKDTALAAVLISWFAAQVIYRGGGDYCGSRRGTALARRNTQGCGNMTDVPPDYTSALQRSLWLQSRAPAAEPGSARAGRCRCGGEGMWARWGVEEAAVVEGGGLDEGEAGRGRHGGLRRCRAGTR